MQILKNWEFAYMFFVHVKCVPECHVRCYFVYGKIVHMYLCTEYFYVKEVLINVHTTYIFKIFFLLLFTFYKVLQNSLPICKQLMLYIKLFCWDTNTSFVSTKLQINYKRSFSKALIKHFFKINFKDLENQRNLKICQYVFL